MNTTVDKIGGTVDENLRVVWVTPDMAAELLRGNLHNRSVRRDKVRQYARAMSDGHWRLANDCIMVTPEGHLINGQHRLLAVIESGVRTAMRINFNASDDDYLVIDNGATRSAGDIFAASGIRQSNATSAIALKIFRYWDKMDLGDTRTLGASHEELFDVYNTVGPDLMQRLLEDSKRLNRLMRGAHAGLYSYVLRGFASSDIVEEWMGLVSLDHERGQDKGFPARTLRDTLITNYRTLTDKARYARCIKAWNAWVREQDVQVLRWVDSEPFPQIQCASGFDTIRDAPAHFVVNLLESKGASLFIDHEDAQTRNGCTVKAVAPNGVITPELIDKIRSRKDEITSVIISREARHVYRSEPNELADCEAEARLEA